MNTKRAVIGIATLAVLGIGYYAISPLFIHVRLDEAVPQAVQSASTTEPLPESAMTAPVIGTALHPASGTARILNIGNQRFLRYENFKTINGPDLYVYLAADIDAKDFINLGPLKATEGNVNYEIPDGVDGTKYRYALVWCKAFGVLFNSADIRPQ